MSSTVSSRPPPWPAISPALREASKPSALTIGTTMLRELLDDVRRARVALLVAVDQLERPLHRELAGRPLAGVVDAHVEEGGLAVVEVDVLGDLDAEHVLAAVGLLGHREELHEVRVLGREVLELGVVVGQRAVAARGRSAAPRRARAGVAAAAPRSLVRAARVLRDEVGDLDGPAQAGLAQRGLVLGAVQDDAEALLAAVLGHVEAEVGEPLLLLARRRDHVDQLRRARPSRPRRRRARSRSARASPARTPRRRSGGTPARARSPPFSAKPLATSWASGDASAASTRAGGVEHRHVPVASSPSRRTSSEPGPLSCTSRVATPAAPGGRRDGRRRRPRRRWRSAARRAPWWRRAAASARRARSPGGRGRAGRRVGEAMVTWVNAGAGVTCGNGRGRCASGRQRLWVGSARPPRFERWILG